MTESLAARLDMSEVAQQSTEELMRDIEDSQKKVSATPEEQEAKKEDEDPRLKKQYTFPFDWTDGRGHKWQGDFKNQILTIGERQLVAIMDATLRNGLPFEAFGPLDRTVSRAVAHMTYSLKSKPSWAKDLRTVTDEELILALYEEVASHEARVHGRQTPEEMRETES